jgi:hypothetical protein
MAVCCAAIPHTARPASALAFVGTLCALAFLVGWSWTTPIRLGQRRFFCAWLRAEWQPRFPRQRGLIRGRQPRPRSQLLSGTGTAQENTTKRERRKLGRSGSSPRKSEGEDRKIRGRFAQTQNSQAGSDGQSSNTVGNTLGANTNGLTCSRTCRITCCSQLPSPRLSCSLDQHFISHYMSLHEYTLLLDWTGRATVATHSVASVKSARYYIRLGLYDPSRDRLDFYFACIRKRATTGTWSEGKTRDGIATSCRKTSSAITSWAGTTSTAPAQNM